MTQVQTAPAPFAEPTKAVTGGWIALFATAWLGIWMPQLTRVQLLRPLQIEEQLHATNWVDNVVAFGVLLAFALSGFCMLTAALTATICDQVPVNQRGFVSGWICAPQAVCAQ